MYGVVMLGLVDRMFDAVGLDARDAALSARLYAAAHSMPYIDAAAELAGTAWIMRCRGIAGASDARCVYAYADRTNAVFAAQSGGSERDTDAVAAPEQDEPPLSRRAVLSESSEVRLDMVRTGPRALARERGIPVTTAARRIRRQVELIEAEAAGQGTLF